MSDLTSRKDLGPDIPWLIISEAVEILRSLSNQHAEARTCTLDSEAYRSARLKVPTLTKHQYAICTAYCTGGMLITPEDEGKENVVSIYFDRNEPYMTHIYNVWQKGKSKSIKGWPKQVANITPVDSTKVIAVQAADLLAWIVGRHYTKGDHEDLFISTRFIVNHKHAFYDQDRILEHYGKQAAFLP